MIDIASLITSKVRIEILKLFSIHPHSTFNINELSRLSGFTPRGVEKELKNLYAGGILKKTITGNQHRYQLDPVCPIFGEIRSLIAKTVGIGDVIRETLAARRCVNRS